MASWIAFRPGHFTGKVLCEAGLSRLPSAAPRPITLSDRKRFQDVVAMPEISLNGMRRLNITLLDVIIGTEIFILAITYSKTYSFFPYLTSLLNWSAALIPLMFIPAALKWRPYSAVFSVSILLLLFFYQLWFSQLWGTRFTGSLIGSYQALITSAMFGIYLRRASLNRLLAVTFIALTIYSILYFYLYMTIDVNSIIIAQSQGDADGFASSIRRTHDSRGGSKWDSEYKVGISGSVTAFLLIYSCCVSFFYKSIKTKIVFRFLLAFNLYIIWISDSRFTTIATILSLITLAFTKNYIRRARFAFAVAVSGAALWTFSALISFNLFKLFADDFSGQARSQEFYIANPVFLDNPILGIGIKNSKDDYDTVFSGNVFPSDLGWYGDILQVGILGLLLILLSFYVMSKFLVRAHTYGADRVNSTILSCYLFYLSLVNFFSPQVTQGFGAFLLCIALSCVGVRGRFLIRPKVPKVPPPNANDLRELRITFDQAR